MANAGNQYNVILSNLTGNPSDGGSSVFLNSATVTWSLKSLDGTVLTSGTCTYVDGSNGRYEGLMVIPVDTPIGSVNLYVLAVQSTYQRTFRLGIYVNAPQPS